MYVLWKCNYLSSQIPFGKETAFVWEKWLDELDYTALCKKKTVRSGPPCYSADTAGVLFLLTRHGSWPLPPDFSTKNCATALARTKGPVGRSRWKSLVCAIFWEWVVEFQLLSFKKRSQESWKTLAHLTEKWPAEPGSHWVVWLQGAPFTRWQLSRLGLMFGLKGHLFLSPCVSWLDFFWLWLHSLPLRRGLFHIVGKTVGPAAWVCLTPAPRGERERGMTLIGLGQVWVRY
jgi:hypothetical protein